MKDKTLLSILEVKFVYTYQNGPLIWLRYIDDIFGAWIGTIEEFNTFVAFLNSREESLKFVATISDTSVPFLDMMVSIKLGILSTSLYTKPTDSHNYLRYDSAHAPHVCESIPYSQFLRIHRICSDWFDAYNHCIEICRYFIHQGYPIKLLLNSLNNALRQDRNSLLHDNSSKNTDAIDSSKTFYYINTFNPSNPSFKNIVQEIWPLLGRSSATRSLTECKIVYGYRRCSNLRDLLVRAKLPPIRTAPKTKKILHTSCQYCAKIDRSGTIRSKSLKFHTMQNINCESSNLIYCLQCNICDIIYVGQTENRIKDRFSNHFSTIRNGYNTTVARHFNQAHGVRQDPPMRIFVLEFIKLPPKTHKAMQTTA